jgi:hypothetical protein
MSTVMHIKIVNILVFAFLVLTYFSTIVWIYLRGPKERLDEPSKGCNYVRFLETSRFATNRCELPGSRQQFEFTAVNSLCSTRTISRSNTKYSTDTLQKLPNYKNSLKILINKQRLSVRKRSANIQPNLWIYSENTVQKQEALKN